VGKRIGVNALVRRDHRLWENTGPTNSLALLFLLIRLTRLFRAMNRTCAKLRLALRKTQVELATLSTDVVSVI
jgi:hypothetical protein